MDFNFYKRFNLGFIKFVGVYKVYCILYMLNFLKTVTYYMALLRHLKKK